MLAENPALTSEQGRIRDRHDRCRWAARSCATRCGSSPRSSTTGPKTTPSGFPPPGERSGHRADRARRESRRGSSFKPTMRLGQADQLTGFIEYDSYTVEGAGAALQRVAGGDHACRPDPRSPGTRNYTKVLIASSVFDIKYSGYRRLLRARAVQRPRPDGLVRLRHRLLFGQQLLLPARGSRPAAGERERHQVRVRVRRSAQPEVRRGVRAQPRRRTKSAIPVADTSSASYGVPYYAYLGGDYLQDATNNRMSLFVQDSWAIGRRLTINAGPAVRQLSRLAGGLRRDDLQATAWGPRIGFAYDMFAQRPHRDSRSLRPLLRRCEVELLQPASTVRNRCSVRTSIPSRCSRCTNRIC